MRVPHLKTAKKPLWRHQSKIFNVRGKTHFLLEGWGAPPPKPPSVFVYNQYLNMCKIFPNYRYFRYFNGKLRNRRPKYGHIRHQRIKINKKQHFVFLIFSNFVFNGFPLFSAAILDRRYKPSMLVCKPIQSNKLKIRMCKLDANSTKNEDVRVPHLKTTKTAVMTSFNDSF